MSRFGRHGKPLAALPRVTICLILLNLSRVLKCSLLFYNCQLGRSALWECVGTFTTCGASLANRELRLFLMKEAAVDMYSLSHARQLLGNLTLLLHQVS